MAFALASAVFAGMTSVLAKAGLGQTDSTVATAVRTIVVLVMSWVVAAIAGALPQISAITPYTWLFLVLSGLATGASWLCYFRALQLGEVSRVVPVDKSSIVLTVILACVFLGEPATPAVIGGIALVAIGTYFMIESPAHADNSGNAQSQKSWVFFALLSALFAALTSILGKVGIEGVDSNLGTAIRTVVVLGMAWIMVAVEGKLGKVRSINTHDLVFLVLSGLATGASWLCFFHALQVGPASVVVPIDKLSVVVSVVLAALFLHERPSPKVIASLVAIVVGTLIMTIT